MVCKSYSFERTPRFKTDDIDIRSKEADPLRSKITRQRLDRSGPLTIPQYKRLWNSDNPEYGMGVNGYVVMGVQGKLDANIDKKGLGYLQDLPNFQELQGSVILYGKNRYLHQIFHNISNINGILYFMKYMGAKTSEVLFDGEVNAEAMETYWGPRSLRPDGVIMKGDKIVFLETDCGTHEFKTLQEKSELYKKLLDSKELQEMGFTDISIVIQSYSRRIYAIKKNGCMDHIQEYVKYLDFLDNEFQHMSQSGPSETNDMKEYRGLDRAIKKAKQQWEDGIELLGKKGYEKSFRDPIAFCNKVKALQGKYVDMEDSRDSFEPVVDFETDSMKRELTSELWVSGKNTDTGV